VKDKEFNGIRDVMDSVRLFTTHDGAANMVKSSRQLKEFTHAVTHALHLLVMIDSLNCVEELQYLVQRCSDIVTKLHYKGFELQDAADSSSKISNLEDILEYISSACEVMDADNDDPVLDSNSNVPEPEKYKSMQT